MVFILSCGLVLPNLHYYSLFLHKHYDTLCITSYEGKCTSTDLTNITHCCGVNTQTSHINADVHQAHSMEWCIYLNDHL